MKINKKGIILGALLCLATVTFVMLKLDARRRGGRGYHGRWRGRPRHGRHWGHRRHWHRRPYRRSWGWRRPWGPSIYVETRPRYVVDDALDSAGRRFWEIRNNTRQPITVASDRERITIEPGQTKDLYRTDSFRMRVISDRASRSVRENRHFITINRAHPIELKAFKR